ncbi:MAG: ATP-dependent zinc metalloprotease FtsH [Succinivibrionaceae bacterium]|nr:ATP-dependent zinc metalloprotease FtsH [Succinivibrionaceae bacterium]
MAKHIFVWLIIAIVIMSLIQAINTSEYAGSTMDYTSFYNAVEGDQVSSVTVTNGRNIIGKTKSDSSFNTTIPVYDENLIKTLREHQVKVTGEFEESTGFWGNMFISWLPVIFLVAVWIYFMRQMQGGGSKAISFGKSKARMLTPDQIKTTFADVAGCDEAKAEVAEVVDFLKEPEKYHKLGGKIPKGILMVGPPGTGKTLLAKAIAGEAKVPFFSISGSDFVEMFVGVGAARVRDMFAKAKSCAPCIVFIDEIDAVGRQRGAGLGGGNDEREQTLNQMLVEMDGFDERTSVIVIAATNRPDVLDPALQRPGRFDRQVYVTLPDIKGREAILNVHMKKVPLAKDVDASVLARSTPGFSGADLQNLVNEAALFAARANLRIVSMHEFELAKDKIMMGTERKSMVMSEKELEMTAYHESGHAIIGRLVPEHDPVYKVSIVPRGRALGVTMFIPEQDRWSQSRQYLNSNIASLFGGRIAEEIIYGKELVSTGASNDIERATNIARKMVTRWGMSDRLGPILYAEEEGEVFLGKSVTKNKHVSDDTAKVIDEEVQKIMFTNYELAKQIITDNMDILHAMKDALLKYETIDSAQLDDLMARREVREPQEDRGEAKEPMDDKQFDKVKDADAEKKNDDVTVVDVSSSNSDSKSNKSSECDSWDEVETDSSKSDQNNDSEKK